MRVLHVVMNLDYGGVESYVVRISSAMVQLGHEVSILTAGGPMESLLNGSGVEIIRAPLKGDAAKKAANLIADRDFHIVNSHNYNSTRAASAIVGLTGTPHVMTVHGPRPFLKRVTFRHWTPHIITVSEADKRGVTGFMGVPSKSVHRSFLPVDTERFYPHKVLSRSKMQYTGTESAKLICHISRFTNRKARIAQALIAAMPAILRSEPDARLLIAGSGPMYDSIVHSAAIANRELGEVIAVRPALPDVAPLFSSSSVVVATATTAMEALACGVPVIAAGRTGYIGIIDLTSLNLGLDLLFGDHGRCPDPVDAEIIAKDIVTALRDNADLKASSDRIAERMATEFTPVSAARSLIGIYEVVRDA